ncbi:hypothetical protein [Rhizobium mongolense]
MERFANKDVEDVYEWRFSARYGERLSLAAHRVLKPLVATRGLQELDLCGAVYAWPKLPDRLGVHVQGKWYLTFDWVDGQGPFEILLERR